METLHLDRLQKVGTAKRLAERREHDLSKRETSKQLRSWLVENGVPPLEHYHRFDRFANE